MNLPFWFARKYFYSRKNKNVINLIAIVSQLAITTCAAALIIVLSVLNGLEDLIISLYNSFDSDIKITLAEGKYFQPDSLPVEKISKMEGVVNFTQVIEEKALVEYREQQNVFTIKAVEPSYVKDMGIDSMIIYGEAILQQDDLNLALVGVGVASKLDLGYFDYSNALQIYFPKKSRTSFYFNPQNAFKKEHLIPSGVFSIQEEYDNKYILAPVDFMQKLTGKADEVTAFEINLEEGTDVKSFRSELEEFIPISFRIEDREEQHASFYNITKLERFMTFVILSFILLIAAFNLIGSLLMLTLEKKRDMMVLKSMGATSSIIQRIFFLEGILLSFSSAVVGILIGVFIVWLQMTFGLVKLGGAGSTFIVDAYPVSLRFKDMLSVFAIVLTIGFLSSFLPAMNAEKDIQISDLNAK